MKYIKIIGIVVGVMTALAVVFAIYWFSHYTLFNISGRSMVEYGINDGDSFWITDGDCNIGDTCVFDCLTEKCHNGLEIIKKVKDKNDNCYWMEGNPSGKYTNDSRKYGWLCDNELKIIGVVK